jgi:GT2 family glycosyltransferase
MQFSAFIMTYERPEIVLNTIQKLFEQTVPPQKILVVDNSASYTTKEAINNLNDTRVEYKRVGYNSGPAGAAKIGLQQLKSEGYAWIHWADDDDPPKFNDCFEILLKLVNSKVGIIGAVGTKFDWNTGLTKRYKDSELHGLLPVDAIGGGYCMIVNAKAVVDETLPDENLFFGMEEFDFCQRVKRAGFEVCVPGELMYRYRAVNNKLGVEKKPSLIPRKEYTQLHREYYSYRNAIYLMKHTYKKNNVMYRYIIRVIGKMGFGYVKGFKFGYKNMILLSKAIIHGMSGKMGKGI